MCTSLASLAVVDSGDGEWSGSGVERRVEFGQDRRWRRRFLIVKRAGVVSELCCHYAIRTLLLAAAHDVAVDPDRVSFVAALRIACGSLSQARGFPPPD